MVSAALAQIGEFSFILAGLGMSLGLLPAEGRDFILGGALLSITLNPLVLQTRGQVAGRVSTAGRLLPASPARRAADGARGRTDAARGRAAAARPAARSADEEVPGVRRPDRGAAGRAADAVQAAIGRPWRARDPRRRRRHRDVLHLLGCRRSVDRFAEACRSGPARSSGRWRSSAAACRTADVTAIDYCLFLTMERQDFEAFIARHPALRAPLDRIAAERARMNVRDGHAAGS
jgi:monovalent cation:H+ antiporter-2, CPA2 family